jgi:hypothetical protein
VSPSHYLFLLLAGVRGLSNREVSGLIEKSWGYDRLYPNALDEWCSYHAYLHKFYQLNCVPYDDLNAYELVILYYILLYS